MTMAGHPRDNGAARALVVAGDERVQRWAGGRLRQVGFEVCATGAGVDALRTAHRDPPDLIVLNHVVPGLDLRRMLTQLRCDPRTAHIPILLIAPGANHALAGVCHLLSVTLLVKRTRRPNARLHAHWPAPVTTRWYAVGPAPGDQS